MDRTQAANYVTVGGLRQYQDLNLAANQQGTALIAADRTAVQEEFVHGLIEATGIVPSAAVLTQAGQAVKRLAGGNVTTVSAAGTTALTADNAGLVVVNATAGAITIDLPAVASANGIPLVFRCVRVDATANAITIAQAGSDQFRTAPATTGAGPLSLVALPVVLIGDGVAEWEVVGPGVTPIAGGGTGAITAGAALTALGAAPLASPAFTGAPTAPAWTISADFLFGLMSGNPTLGFATGYYINAPPGAGEMNLYAGGTGITLNSAGQLTVAAATSSGQAINMGQFSTVIGANYTVTKWPDPTTATGIRIRQTGITPSFASETEQTITYPVAMTGVLPGGWGATINPPAWSNGIDQGAQVIGTPTATSMVIGMQEYGGGTYTWPMVATYWVEGY